MGIMFGIFLRPRVVTHTFGNSLFSALWRACISISFCNKDSLWLHVQRRGVSFELETTRRESPVLYGTVTRAAASTGGGPGSRWHLFQYYESLHQKRRPPHHTYDMENLRYGTLDPKDRYCNCQHREAHRGCSRGFRSELALERRWEKLVSNRRQGRQDYREWKRECKDAYPVDTHDRRAQFVSRSSLNLIHSTHFTPSPGCSI